eukprot:6207199-Pleurochrysis_carterae.AAC.1
MTRQAESPCPDACAPAGTHVLAHSVEEMGEPARRCRRVREASLVGRTLARAEWVSVRIDAREYRSVRGPFFAHTRACVPSCVCA